MHSQRDFVTSANHEKSARPTNIRIVKQTNRCFKGARAHDNGVSSFLLFFLCMDAQPQYIKKTVKAEWNLRGLAHS